MLKYIIKGGNELQGKVRVSGAKNAVLKMMIASLLSRKPVLLKNAPRISDLMVTLEICKILGCKAEWDQDRHILSIDAGSLNNYNIPDELGAKNRMSVMTVGPLIHRFGNAVIPKMGGCRIGARPVDFHLNALKTMGAVVEEDECRYVVKADKLRGAMIRLPFPSVSATENIVMAAVLAEGTTVIRNAAVEPETIDLIRMLQKMGALIDVQVNRRILIEGVNELKPVEHNILPDRNEAASLLAAGIVTNSRIIVDDARQIDLMKFYNTLQRAGVRFQLQDNSVELTPPHNLKPIAVETDVHPGFMTDWQQPFTVIMTQIHGLSTLHETIYEDRLGYTGELKKMGADIVLFKQCLGQVRCRFRDRGFWHSCVVRGKTDLKGARVMIPDLRAGCSLVIAALCAEGVSEVCGAEHVHRGYDNLHEKLKMLGADIELAEE